VLARVKDFASVLEQNPFEAAAGNHREAGDAFPHYREINDIHTGAATHVKWSSGIKCEEMFCHKGGMSRRKGVKGFCLLEVKFLKCL
jgi:hypothetical protein